MYACVHIFYLSLFVHTAFDPSSSMMLHRHLMDLMDLGKAKVEEGKPRTHSKDLHESIHFCKILADCIYII